MLTEGLLFADRYELQRLLGRGGFSEVWLAQDTRANIEVAVKVYAPGQGLDDAGISLFTQEFSLVFDLNHTNLLRPTYFDCWERMPFLILPYCRHGSAFAYLSPGTDITEDQCWQLLHDVAAGLAYLHEKTPPVIHQDIKPDNILISDEGSYMITDFGISARVRSTMRAGSHAEQSGGTLAYMGPERFSSNPRPVPASDIWSLGAMMYELMTKDTPFGNHGGILQKNGAEIPIISEDYSNVLKQIVYRCLSASPTERPTASTIADLTYAKLHGHEVDIAARLGLQTDTLAQPAADTAAQPADIATPTAAADTATPASFQPATEPARRFDPRQLWQDRRVQIGAAVAVVIAIVIGIAATCSGHSGDAEPVLEQLVEAEPLAAPVINTDSINAVVRPEYFRADSLILLADTYMAGEEWYDEQYMVEEKYMEALNILLAASTEAMGSLLDSLAERRETAQTQLVAVQQRLDSMANEFADYADIYLPLRERLDRIEPFTATDNTDD